jgi:hypothetical protein
MQQCFMGLSCYNECTRTGYVNLYGFWQNGRGSWDLSYRIQCEPQEDKPFPLFFKYFFIYFLQISLAFGYFE